MKLSKMFLRLFVAVVVYAVIFILERKFTVEHCADEKFLDKVFCWFFGDPQMTSALIAGAVFGFKQKINVSVLGFAIPIIGLVVVWMFGYASDFFGSNYWYGVIQHIKYSVVPAILASVAISALSNKNKKA